MCPLRVILIFLSAILAGFFLLKNFKSSVSSADDNSSSSSSSTSDSLPSHPSRSYKIRTAIASAFWTCVDMASGRYLWRHLVSSSSSSSSKTT